MTKSEKTVSNIISPKEKLYALGACLGIPMIVHSIAESHDPLRSTIAFATFMVIVTMVGIALVFLDHLKEDKKTTQSADQTPADGELKQPSGQEQ